MPPRPARRGKKAEERRGRGWGVVAVHRPHCPGAGAALAATLCRWEGGEERENRGKEKRREREIKNKKDATCIVEYVAYKVLCLVGMGGTPKLQGAL